jgi:putative ABC transport system permease protein
MNPPRAPRAVLAWLTRPQDREFLLNDLDDEFQATVQARGSRAASRWYWRQMATSMVPLAVSRLSWISSARRTDDASRRRPHVFGSFARDVGHAARALAKARAFTVVCVTSLGLGMGTVIAILVLMRATFGTPPGVNADGLVELVIVPHGLLRTQTGSRVIDTWSYPDFVDLRDADTGMAITGWTIGDSMLRLPGRGGATREPTMYVSSNYFTIVGAAPTRGRGFDAAHDESTAQPSVIIGYRLWQNRLGSDPDIIGRTITLNGVAHVVVGVAPSRFSGHLSPEGTPDIQLWLPLRRHPRIEAADQVRFNRDVAWIHVLGRLSPGTNLPQADAAVASIMSALAERYPASNQFKAGSVEVYSSTGARMKTDILATRVMLLSLSGMVLLLVCLNISGMMLVRSAMRERELAIRLAIGAGRGRLMQYLLSEALVLSVVGGSLGAALLFGVPAAVFWAFGVWRPELDVLLPDAWTAVESVALCFVTTLVFGLTPAIRFSRPSIVSALKESARGGTRRVGRFHRITAAVQAGIAVPFLVIGGVRLDQARVTASADLGFKPEGLFAAPLSPVAAESADEDRRLFLRTVQEKVASTSGVVSVTFADGLPLDFTRRVTGVSREGDAARVPAHTTRVAPGYLETLGVRLRRGRDIAPDDRAGTELVVMISEPLAARLFSTRDPVGERLTFALDGGKGQVFTIVGITADVVTSQMGEPRPQMFVPLAQHRASNVLVIARGSGSDASMRRAFENAVTSVDPDFVLASVVTGDGLVRRSRSDLLVHSTLGGGAAGVALILAALGVYGVIGFMVATRTREIGVRVALGASEGRVLRDVLVDALKLVVPGVAIGLILASLWLRVVDPSWYPLGGVEPLVYALAAATAFFVALVAGIPSALRAAAVEPIDAMRAE